MLDIFFHTEDDWFYAASCLWRHLRDFKCVRLDSFFVFFSLPMLLLLLSSFSFSPVAGLVLDGVVAESQCPSVVFNVIPHERADKVVAVVVAGLHSTSDGIPFHGRSCKQSRKKNQSVKCILYISSSVSTCYKCLGLELLREEAVRGALVNKKRGVRARVGGHQGCCVMCSAGCNTSQVSLM